MTIPADRAAGFHGRIGIARQEITPPLGIYARNWGAATHDVAESIHRPLTLSALSLSTLDGGNSLLLIDADLGWWRTPVAFQKFQRTLLAELEMQPHELAFALTHTHAAPPLMEFDESLPGAEILRDWYEDVLQAAISTAKAARENAIESVLEWRTGQCGLATVRDFADPEPGATRFLCGFAPDQQADQTLIVGRITDSVGAVRGVIVNYACHPTTLAWQNRAISPDYIGAMRETIENAVQAPALFLLGACGELAPAYQYVGDPAIADRHGRELGYAALSTLNGMHPPSTALAYQGTVESGAPLAVWEPARVTVTESLVALDEQVDLPLKDWPTADELEQQRQNCEDRALSERLRRKRDIRRGLGDGREFTLPLTIWKIGDAVLVASCCEAYSTLQQTLRAEFPGQTILCMNLVNGSLGYLPPAELYEQDIYPVWQTPFDHGSLEKMQQTLTAAIHQLTRE